jgi:hypothetical protein
LSIKLTRERPVAAPAASIESRAGNGLFHRLRFRTDPVNVQ